MLLSNLGDANLFLFVFVEVVLDENFYQCFDFVWNLNYFEQLTVL